MGEQLLIDSQELVEGLGYGLDGGLVHDGGTGFDLDDLLHVLVDHHEHFLEREDYWRLRWLLGVLGGLLLGSNCLLLAARLLLKVVCREFGLVVIHGNLRWWSRLIDLVLNLLIILRLSLKVLIRILLLLKLLLARLELLLSILKLLLCKLQLLISLNLILSLHVACMHMLTDIPLVLISNLDLTL